MSRRLQIAPCFADRNHLVKCEIREGRSWSLRSREKNVRLSLRSRTLGVRVEPSTRGKIAQPFADRGLFVATAADPKVLGWVIALEPDEALIDITCRWTFAVGASTATHRALIPVYVEHRLFLVLEDAVGPAAYAMLPGEMSDGDGFDRFPYALALHADLPPHRDCNVTRVEAPGGFGLILSETLELRAKMI